MDGTYPHERLGSQAPQGVAEGYPSRETAPSEYALLVVFAAAVFIIVGVVALAMGFSAPILAFGSIPILTSDFGGW